MGLASKLLRGLGKRASDKVMDRVGGKLVSGMADTSADAPSAFHKPKRDVYRHMVEGGRAGLPRPPAPDAAADADGGADPAADPAADHDHDHDHDHES
ncbi:hypothetical protein L6R53_25680 [Myxococcota bacterium]|nr:hypothetical protein [Myxococcota bacterium]